jgi:sulfate adenylyltransferase subunit 1
MKMVFYNKMNTQNELLEADIQAYLKQHQQKDLLKFLTCGSVDDGKSTLIGRLLHDSKMIFEDQLSAIEKESKKSGTQGDKLDLALLVDGLQSEREQGITIDVAYRYFTTDTRKFIIADTPGHEQYTRNMATGASNCDLAIILVDASAGIKSQTKRHSYIVSLLGIKNIIVAVNKMDLVNYEQSVFDNIKSEYMAFCQQLNFSNVQVIPVSALNGDNVVEPSKELSWYHGLSLIKSLEKVDVSLENINQPNLFRFPVQWVNRANSNFRGFSGTVSNGTIKVNDDIIVLPSGKKSRIKSIVTFDGELVKASAGEVVTLTLFDEIDISRGDMICLPNDIALLGNYFDADIVWMSENGLIPNKQYDFKFSCKACSGSVEEVLHKIDINSLQNLKATHLELNETGLCRIKLTQKVVFDLYESSPQTGSFIIIDRMTNNTVAAGMVKSLLNLDQQTSIHNNITEFELELNALVRKHLPHWEANDISQLLTKRSVI